eukprot:jgi/Chrpa1/2414/Chrysochromulina_OHIO_Genome00003185-RA
MASSIARSYSASDASGRISRAITLLARRKTGRAAAVYSKPLEPSLNALDGPMASSSSSSIGSDRQFAGSTHCTADRQYAGSLG